MFSIKENPQSINIKIRRHLHWISIHFYMQPYFRYIGFEETLYFYHFYLCLTSPEWQVYRNSYSISNTLFHVYKPFILSAKTSGAVLQKFKEIGIWRSLWRKSSHGNNSSENGNASKWFYYWTRFFLLFFLRK